MERTVVRGDGFAARKQWGSGSYRQPRRHHSLTTYWTDDAVQVCPLSLDVKARAPAELLAATMHVPAEVQVKPRTGTLASRRSETEVLGWKTVPKVAPPFEVTEPRIETGPVVVESGPTAMHCVVFQHEMAWNVPLEVAGKFALASDQVEPLSVDRASCPCSEGSSWLLGPTATHFTPSVVQLVEDNGRLPVSFEVQWAPPSELMD